MDASGTCILLKEAGSRMTVNDMGDIRPNLLSHVASAGSSGSSDASLYG